MSDEHKIYVVVGQKDRPNSLLYEQDGEPWPVCWRMTAEEAADIADILEAEALAFANWRKEKLMLNNSIYRYADEEERKISTMLDPNFDVRGTVYAVWAVSDNPRGTGT